MHYCQGCICIVHNNETESNVHAPYPAVIFQIGTDIIYTLSCVRDFKQQMLTTAIQDGMLEVGVWVRVGGCVCVGVCGCGCVGACILTPKYLNHNVPENVLSNSS